MLFNLEEKQNARSAQQDQTEEKSGIIELASVEKDGFTISWGLKTQKEKMQEEKPAMLSQMNEPEVAVVPVEFKLNSIHPQTEEEKLLKLSKLSSAGYFREILQGRGYWSVWANFQKRSLFLDHSIEHVPDISLGEDAILMVQLLSFARKVVTIDIPILNYYVRPNSLSRSEVVSDKMYKDLRAYTTWIEHYLQRKGLIREFEEDLAHLQLQNLFLAMHWKRYEDAPIDLRKAANDLKRMPGLRAELTKRQLKILSVYQLSGWLGDLYLSYYRSRGKI